MAYRACFQCELLFEVDDVDLAAELSCPQCGLPVEPYDPDDGEVEAPEATVTVEPGQLPELDPAIVKTMAFDGLSDAVKAKAAERRAAPAPVAAPVPMAAPAPVSAPVPNNPFPARAGRTRVLGAVDDAGRPVDPLLDDLAPRPAPVAPTAPKPARVPRPVEAPMPPTAAMAITPAAPAPEASRPAPLRPVDPEKGRSTLPPTGGRKKKGLLIALVVVLLGGGGFAGWWFGLRTKGGGGEAAPATTPATDAPAAWDARIEQQLEAGQARLPVVSGPEAMTDGGAWIAGGPEGLQASFGPVAGLPSTLIRDTMVESDADGEWVGALARRLSAETLPTGQPLAFGLPKEQKVKDLLRLAYAGVKGGVGDFVLLVARNSGGLGGLGFTVHRRKDTLDGEVLVLRIGRTTGFHVTVQAGGEVKSAEPRILPRRETDGTLDLRALRERLEELGEAHPGVKTVVIHPLPDMTVGELAGVMGELRGTGERPRFAHTRLALR